MSREEFKQLFYLDKEIQVLEQEKEEAETNAMACTQKITPAPGGTNAPGNKIETGAVKAADIDGVIDYILYRRNQEKANLLMLIDQVEDAEMRMILHFRYLKGLSWRDVARKMGTTESAVKNKELRFFKKN